MREQLGLLRSLLIYYGQPWKHRRMHEFYAQFIQPDALCFDVGAHVGNRLWIWLRLGARCVAIEPQPHCMELLRRWYGDRNDVTLVEAAVGAQPGRHVLFMDPTNPTVTTLSEDWMAAMREDEAFRGVRWEEALEVAVTTLDALIAEHGRPDFCKIDVEGYELEVLAGLSQPLSFMSFEYMYSTPETTLACLERLGVLGHYRYNWSPGESHRLASPAWLAQDELAAALADVVAAGTSGDIYARLEESL